MPSTGSSHEDFSRTEVVKGSSDRAFGLTVGGVLLLIAGFRWIFVGGSAQLTIGLGAVGAVLVLAGLLAPGVLAPLNRLWLKLGLLLHRITNPLIMVLMFYLTLAPVGLLMRAFGKDPLRLRFEPQAKSYWIQREPPGPSPESMKQQF